MSEAPRSAAPREPALVEPISSGFEYRVLLGVAIPLSWARALKTVGERHYDYKCREVAKQGVVNGLHNTALWNEEADRGLGTGDDHVTAEVSTHAISSSDCNIMLKILEQACYHQLGDVVVDDIRRWLRGVMDRIAARHAEILR